MSEFSGVVVLTDDEFDRMMEHMNAPCEPSEAAKRGAALLERLYGMRDAPKSAP